MTSLDLTWILSQAFTCLVVADFLSGVGHWLEDAYGREHWPVTGKLVTQPNILHHRRPRHFTQHGWLHSSWLLILLSAGGVLIAWGLGLLDWRVWLVAVIAANANQIHKWAHRSAAENGRLITWLQRIGLLQSTAHHARHHQHAKNTHYCIVTNWLNPLLDAIGFWSGLEWLIHRTTGMSRRVDHSTNATVELPTVAALTCRHCHSDAPHPRRSVRRGRRFRSSVTGAPHEN